MSPSRRASDRSEDAATADVPAWPWPVPPWKFTEIEPGRSVGAKTLKSTARPVPFVASRSDAPFEALRQGCYIHAKFGFLRMQGNLAASGAKPAGLDWIARSAALPLADSRAEAIAVLVLVPLSLGVAFWNGFPIIFYDTGAYLLEGLGRAFLAERSPVYSLLLDYAGARESLWFVALLQAAATSFVMVETARAIAPRLSLAAMLGIGLGLVLVTGLPWYVGQIEPDCFAAVAILAFYLLAFHGAVLAGWRNWLLVAIASLAIAVHPSHLLLGISLAATIIVYRVVLRIAKTESWQPARIAEPVACCMMGLVLIVASNFVLT